MASSVGFSRVAPTPAEIEILSDPGDSDDIVKRLPGRSRSWVREHRQILRKQRMAAGGFHVRGESILYDAKGDEIARWVKTSADREKSLAMLLDKAAGLAKPWAKSIARVVAPKQTSADLLVVYPMGDPHIGLYAWAKESGEEFDKEKAERNLVGAVDALVRDAPPASRALILNLGDFFHTDSSENRTRRSGAVLDVEGKWPEILECGIRAMKRCIERSLEKHAQVDVWNLIGNHDDQTAIVLSVVLREAYSNNPRVRVNCSPAAFLYERFGKVLIGATHGHQTSADKLGQVMAADRARDWGETQHRYWYTGHIHHDTVKEVPGCKIESFRTLAARDAWHTASGYRSGRDMKCIVLHREHGEVARQTFTVGML